MIYIHISDRFIDLNKLASISGLSSEKILDYVNRGLFGVREEELSRLAREYDEGLLQEVEAVQGICEKVAMET